jgi:hypothetical protein
MAFVKDIFETSCDFSQICREIFKKILNPSTPWIDLAAQNTLKIVRPPLPYNKALISTDPK